MSVLEYAGAIIPGIKTEAITPQAVVKQIGITTQKAAGQTMRAVGLAKGVSATKFGRFYTITVKVPKGVTIVYADKTELVVN